MKTSARLSFIATMTAIILIASWGLFSGCSTTTPATTTVYNGAVLAGTTLDASKALWDAYVAGGNASTNAQIAVIKAYIAANQADVIVLQSAQAIVQNGTNTANLPLLLATMSNASAAYAASSSNFIALVAQLKVK